MRHARSPVATEDLLANPGWLRGIAGRLVQDECEVDDLVHEAWLAVLRGPTHEVRHLPSWMAAVLQNLSRRRLRYVGRHVELDSQRALSLEDEQPDPGDHMDLHVARERVAGAVLELPEPFRTTVLESYFEGLKPAEIARRHGIPSATVRTRLNRAVHRLRDALVGEEDGRAPIWGGLMWIARPPRTSAPLSQPAPLAALGLAASVAALFAIAATFVLRSGPGGAGLDPRADGAAMPEAASAARAARSTADARPAALGRDTVEHTERGASGGHGARWRQLGESFDAWVAPLIGHGDALPQPARSEASDEPERPASNDSKLALRAYSSPAVERAATVDVAAALASADAAARSESVTAPAAAPGRASVALAAPRGRGIRGAWHAALPIPTKGTDEELDDESGEGEGLPGHMLLIGQPSGDGAAGGEAFGVRKQARPHGALEMELASCPCLDRITLARWLALRALVESGRVDPRRLIDPCSLCDEPFEAQVVQLQEGVGAVLLLHRVAPEGDELVDAPPSLLRELLPFEEAVFVRDELVRSVPSELTAR